MSSSLPPSIGALTPQVLHFSCGACGSGLSVPVALAGVSGPCPICRSTITAPTVGASGPAASESAGGEVPPRILSPPVRRGQEPMGGSSAPLERPGAGQPASVSEVGLPRRETEAVSASERPYGPPPRRPPSATLPSPRQTAMAGDADAAETERDSREFASRREALEFSLHGRRGLSPGARGWLAGVAGGLIVCVIGGAALWMGQFRRQRLPVSGTANRPTPELDRSLGAMAELQRQREADQAQLLASQQAALRFLHSRTSAEALPWTSARPSDEAGWQGVPFPADRLAVRPDERLQLLKWRRTADDDEPMSLWRWGSDEHSLVVWVEATARGPAVRWDAWRQHQQGLLAAFAATPGAPQGSYFVRLSLKPGVGADSAGSLGPLVASSPFGGADRCEFELHIDPSDPRAGEWSTALSPTKPREFLAVLLWKEAGGGTAPQPWIRRGPAATAPQPPPLAQAPPGTE